MATASLQTRSLVTVCLRGSGWQGKRRVVTGSRVKTLNLVRASASSSSGETETRAPLETRLALALQEDTALPKNQNPIPPPPLPDLKDLALMASLEISDAEAEKWTPQVHGVLRWMSKLNEVDLASAATRDVSLYRDTWRMPLREDTVTDFKHRNEMYGECGTWEKPFVKVRGVDKKEAAKNASDAKSNAKASDRANEASDENEASSSDASSSNSDDASESDLTDDVLGMSLLVGKVVGIEKHPESPKLYVEQVDCGDESGPRTICSGLVPYLTEDDILGKNVVVVANLKPRSMGGVPSAGMLLCANDGRDGDDRKVELLVAPDAAVPGERLTFGKAENVEPHGANKVAKKKLWEKTQVDLVTNQSREATWRGVVLTSSAGAVTCASLKGGGIS